MQARFESSPTGAAGDCPVASHRPTAAFYLARWAIRRLGRGHGRVFGHIPRRVWGGNALTVETDVGSLLIPVWDLGARSLLFYGGYRHERAETDLLSRILKGARCVIDVGASLGWYSVLAARVSPEARVHAFEPNPEILPYLRTNCVSRGIEVHPLAVSDSNRIIEFFCAPSSNLSSASRKVGRRIRVPATTLDDLDFQKADFVKVDVEGGEAAVLRGARRLRARSPEAIWMIEADEQMLREAGSSLEELDHEFALPESTRLYTVDPAGRWRPLEAFSSMRGSLHKNVLVVPRGAGIAGLIS